MIKIFQTMEDGLMDEITAFQKGCWIDLVNPTDDEVETVVEATGIPEDMLKAALDEEETARYENEDGNSLFVFDVPIIEDMEDWYVYSTLPMAFIYNRNCVVTVSLKENAIIREFTGNRVKGVTTERPVKFLLNFMYRTAVKFLQYLRQIDKTSHRVQAELHRSMKNKELIQLLDLENSLVYFSTSLTANEKVLDRVRKLERVKNDEENEDLLDDVMIEHRQASEMCNIYRDILSGTMDAFASVISNNVNVVMKTLTIITIVMTIPTLIASLWGMNVPVPFAGSKYGFWIVIGLCVLCALVGTVVLMKMTSGIRFNRARKRERITPRRRERKQK